MIVIFFILIIVFLLILVNINTKELFKTTTLITRPLSFESVIINPDTDFLNKEKQEYYKTTTNKLASADLSINNGIIYDTIQLGNTVLKAKDIRDYKKNNPGRFVLKNNLDIQGYNYSASTKGLWSNAKIDEESIPTEIIINKDNTSISKSIDGQIADDVIKRQCSKINPKNKLNRFHDNPIFNESEFPGCNSNCCSPLYEPDQIVYDKLCIGKTCINGDHLKVLKGDKMISIKSKVNNKCMAVPNTNENAPLHHPSFSDILTNTDCIKYIESIETECIPSDNDTRHNIGSYINGSIDDAKNACNNNIECVGFTYRFTSDNKVYDELFNQTFNNEPTGSYLLKNKIIATHEPDIENNSIIPKKVEDYSCFVNNRSDINSKLDKNNIYYQILIDKPVDVKVSIPKNIDRILQIEKNNAELINNKQRQKEAQEQELSKQINNYNLQEDEKMEKEYPPPRAKPHTYKYWEWRDYYDDDGWL